MKNLLNEIIEKGNYVFIADNGHWEYDRVGIGELGGKVYRFFLDDEMDEGVWELREGLSMEDVLNEGIELGFFEKIEVEDWGVSWYMDLEKEDEIVDWLGGLDK